MFLKSLITAAVFVSISVILMSGMGHADSILSTATSGGEVAYLVNCTALCSVNLTDDRTGELLDNTTHTTHTWGIFQDVGAGMFNLTLWSGGENIDSLEVNTGTFNPQFTNLVNDRLGKEVVGGAVLFGVSLGSALLGFEAGFLLVGLCIMVEAEQGYAPAWTVTFLIIFAGTCTGLAFYSIFGGLK